MFKSVITIRGQRRSGRTHLLASWVSADPQNRVIFVGNSGDYHICYQALEDIGLHALGYCVRVIDANLRRDGIERQVAIDNYDCLTIDQQIQARDVAGDNLHIVVVESE